VASDRALPRPWSRVLWISGRNRLMVRARATNSGMRQRRAQASQPAGQQRPSAGALGLEGGAELLLEEVGPVR